MSDNLYKSNLSDMLSDIGIFSKYADEEEIVNTLDSIKFNQFSYISANVQGLPNNNLEFINFINKLNSKLP